MHTHKEKYINKGWRVHRQIDAKTGNEYYIAKLSLSKTQKNTVKEYVGCFTDRKKAITLAIKAAVKNRTINWAATQKYLDEENITITQEQLDTIQTSKRSKGWYLMEHPNKVFVYIKDGNRKVYAGVCDTVEDAIIFALEEAKKTPYYDKEQSKRFIKAHFSEHINLLRHL